MSQLSLVAASQLFDTELTTRYQNKQFLAGTIEERHGTTGVGTNVPVSDAIDFAASNFAPTNKLVTPVDETNVFIQPIDYYVKTVIGGGEKTLFAFDKIVEHAKLHALAAGRIVDYVKIQSLINDPSYGSLYTVPVNTGANTGMNALKLSNALSQLEANAVDVMNHACSLWMPALVKKAMMADQLVTNIFYNDVKPLTNNRITAYLGTDIRTLGQAGINSIPFTGTSPEVFLVPLVHEDSMIQIFNRDVKTSITWVPQEDRWEVLSTITTGARVIQSNGIALITCNNPYA